MSAILISATAGPSSRAGFAFFPEEVSCSSCADCFPQLLRKGLLLYLLNTSRFYGASRIVAMNGGNGAGQMGRCLSFVFCG